MIRKQLYITEQQDKALKQRAKDLGVSEAELVRAALDDALQPSEGTRSRRLDALARLVENTKLLARRHRLPDGYRFDRDDLYDRGDARS